MLLAQPDSPGTTEADLLTRAFEAAGVTEVYRSQDPGEADQLLEARRLAFPALERPRAVLLDDVALTVAARRGRRADRAGRG